VPVLANNGAQAAYKSVRCHR